MFAGTHCENHLCVFVLFVDFKCLFFRLHWTISNVLEVSLDVCNVFLSCIRLLCSIWWWQHFACFLASSRSLDQSRHWIIISSGTWKESIRHAERKNDCFRGAEGITIFNIAFLVEFLIPPPQWKVEVGTVSVLSCFKTPSLLEVAVAFSKCLGPGFCPIFFLSCVRVGFLPKCEARGRHSEMWLTTEKVS